MVALLGDQERLGRVAPGRGGALDGVSLRRGAVLRLLLVLTHGGMRATDERGVRNVGARVGRGVR